MKPEGYLVLAALVSGVCVCLFSVVLVMSSKPEWETETVVWRFIEHIIRTSGFASYHGP